MTSGFTGIKAFFVGRVWHLLTAWATDKKESKIVRVNSIQGLFKLLLKQPELQKDFDLTTKKLEKEKIASIAAGLRKLKHNSP